MLDKFHETSVKVLIAASILFWPAILLLSFASHWMQL